MRHHTPVSFAAVKIDGGFWHERLETVWRTTIPEQYRHFDQAGVIAALGDPDSAEPAKPTVGKSADAELAKWLEAASASLAFQRNTVTEEQIGGIVDALAKAQLEDGYANTWFIRNAPGRRWSNLRDDRELQAAGHLIEAAVAMFQASGEPKLMDVALRFADHIAATFGRGEDQRRGYCGYPEIELALLRLYSASKDEKHRDLAAYFIDERGRQPHYFDIEAVARGDETSDYVGRTYEYTQSHRRVRAQESAIGHAARALNLYAAMAEMAAIQNDQSLKRAADTLWADVTRTQMYVTGGVGPERRHDAFTVPFDLPNATAAATTPAAAALVNWAKRMLMGELDGAIADVMELALYNAALAGISHDGEHYFHFNPLASEGEERRWTWQKNSEAATDIARLIASVGGLFYSTGEDCIAIHLYGGASTTVSLGGKAVSIKEMSRYPWSGHIRVTVEPEAADEFTLRLRIPAFARDARARINGAAIDVGDNLVRGYLELRRRWEPGDAIELDLPMTPERIYANPAVAADTGLVAIRRGPLIYCFEQADNIAAPVSRMRLPKGAALVDKERADLFGGIVAVTVDGSVAEIADWRGALYRRTPVATRSVSWSAIPYYLWANREPGEMRVWVAED